MTRQELQEQFEQRLLNQSKLNDLGHYKHLLGMLLDQLELYIQAKQIIEEEGFFIYSDTDRGGRTKKANPALKVIDSSMDNFIKLSKEFGLSPSQAREFQGTVFEEVSKNVSDVLKLPS